jgi:hypothetical protein
MIRALRLVNLRSDDGWGLTLAVRNLLVATEVATENQRD